MYVSGVARALLSSFRRPSRREGRNIQVNLAIAHLEQVVFLASHLTWCFRHSVQASDEGRQELEL